MPCSKETRALRQQLYLSQFGRCFWCKRVCIQRKLAQIHFKANDFTVDHVKPKSVGGRKRDPDNAVGACYRCNQYRNILFTKLMCGRPIGDFLARDEALRDKLLESVRPYVNELPC